MDGIDFNIQGLLQACLKPFKIGEKYFRPKMAMFVKAGSLEGVMPLPSNIFLLILVI